MRYSKKSFINQLDNIKKLVLNQTLLPCFSFCKNGLFLPIKGNRNFLVFSLNIHEPLLYVVEFNQFKYNPLPTHFSKKYNLLINEAKLDYLEFIDKSNTLIFELINEQEQIYRLYFELFTLKPNIYICDENDIILESYFPSEQKINDKYVLSDDVIDQDNLLTNSVFENNFHQLVNSRIEEKYCEPIRLCKRHIKSAKRKINNINEDVKIANNNLKNGDIADEILSLGLDLKKHVDEVTLFDGSNYKLDKSLTIYQNVEKLYKSVRKAKSTIEHSKDNLNEANVEIELYSKILDLIYVRNEKTVDEMLEEFGLISHRHQVVESIFNMPQMINLNGTIFLYGKNAKQNDCLSFLLKLDREFTWLHIKDYSGSHIIIKSKKPTENELLFASELALYLSKKEAGEITYTKKKNVRKGHNPGEAILKNYTTIKLNHIRKESIEYIKNHSEPYISPKMKKIN